MRSDKGEAFMEQKNTGFEIKADQRQSWTSIAMVWAGGMICVPCLMIGGVLVGGGLSFAQIVASILLGYGMICAYMIFIGMQACDTGLPVSVMASGALGEKGARYIIFNDTGNSMRRLVWHSVGGLRQRVCVDGREHVGLRIRKRNGGNDLLHCVGCDNAVDGLPGIQWPEVAQLHCRACAGYSMPVRNNRQHGPK